MKVEEILNSKGTEIFSVSSDATVSAAVDVLGEKNIGAVIVNNPSGNVCGIFSERDVVRRLRTQGADLLQKPVSSCMTPNPFTCEKGTTLDALLATMTEKRIRHMPVVENGALVGVVSIGDIVKRKIETAEREAETLREYISS